MFVSKEDLETLTGFSRRSAQIRWLTRRGFRFLLNALGNPVVAVEEVSGKLVGGATRSQARAEPNWASLNVLRLRFDEPVKGRGNAEKSPRLVRKGGGRRGKSLGKVKMLPPIGQPSVELGIALIHEQLAHSAASKESVDP